MLTYTIAMPAPHTHLFHVSVEVDNVTDDYVDLKLPVWTPGSYMIREYARHVQSFSASTDHGQPLTWQKVTKSTWRIATEASSKVIARYQVYAHELTVRTSHLDASHGYINGATVFMYVPERTNEQLRVLIDVPSGWLVTTGLRPLVGDALMPDPRPKINLYTANDYDELVDCPIECGTHRLLTFDVDGIPHQIALWGQGNEQEPRLIADTRRIVEIQRDFFGHLPYTSYTFILHLTDGRGGGLEHRNSVSNQVDRWTFQPERSYERYLALTSHELFHVWNVKRLRPAALGPFDYQTENYTRLLWFVEGATSYYDHLLLVRAGLIKPERYLARLSETIFNLQSQPGRHVQSLEASSFDAWIKLYRPDENSANSSISYYLKGSLVCLLLDLAIREVTHGEASFDDVMRLLFARYPLNGTGLPEDGAILAAVEEVAGGCDGRFRDFFANAIAGTSELDYHAALAVVGLVLVWKRHGPRAWTGLTLRSEGQRTIVATVRSDSPGYAAGIYPDDELLAINGWRINETKLQARLAEHQPGQVVRFTLFRGDQLIDLPLTLAEAPPDGLELVPMKEQSSAQQQAYRNWLGLEA
ncbi:M61 family metallopeptidase [Candidatus Chloroploca asiatica]|uniref:Peptidase M61 n=1 Tax=Candidatus Chloroploca asiatica TaxID=1506545 RepID=A0A2H3KNM3_9CHLR|nr:PDZ domain-containing protein [Candidatus Chloroploca asiatica]PDV99747.1 peptidase M61 [Candidatus Chloroploca asiatica]